MQKSLIASLLVLVSCGAEPGPDQGPGEEPPVGEASLAGTRDQGTRDQGTGTTGTGIVDGAQYGSGWLGAQPLEDVHIEKGEIVAAQTIHPTGTATSLSACPWSSTTTGVARNCGWSAAAVGSCAPGGFTVVGAGGCGFGWGNGDSMLRICSGTAPCDFASSTRIATNDNACSSLLPKVSFTCPASGLYTVMIASARPNTAYGYSLGAPYGQLPAKQVRRGTALRNATFTGTTQLLDTGAPGESVTLKITSVTPAGGAYNLPPEGSAPDGTTFRYEVSVGVTVINKTSAVTDGTTWTPLCVTTLPKSYDPTHGTYTYAIPMEKVWDGTGARRDEVSDRFTFACMSGAIAKCYAWGYRPWVSDDSKKVHQACTRMARADYCGDGKPHTQEATTINIEDDLGVQAHDPSGAAGEMPFEAGWSEAGAVCLSKYRWDHLPIDANTPLCPTPGHQRPYKWVPDITSPRRGRYEPVYCKDKQAAVDYAGMSNLFVKLFDWSAAHP